MTQKAITVQNLYKQYKLGETIRHDTFRDQIAALFSRSGKKPTSSEDNFWALEDISFELEQGEILGIVGKNGAGKSTLLKVLSRITSPTRGRIEIAGRVGSLLEVGTGFHPELTGRENIYMNAAILGMRRSEIRRKFDEIVDFAEVEKFIDTPIKRYSSGMVVRLAFAVAAHIEPEVLIVDEVLAVGDVRFQRKSLGKMSEVASEGRTVLFVSHNMEAIRRLCTRSILLEQGRVALDGTTHDVINRYLATNIEAQQAFIQLPEDPRGAGIGQALTLQFLDMNNRPCTVFQTGAQWRIVLEFELFVPNEHLVAGIGVQAHDDALLTMLNSAPMSLEAGRYRVDYLWSHPITSTNLKFIIGLSKNEQNFYVAANIGSVEISEVAVSDDLIPVKGSENALLYTQHHVVPQRIEEP